MRSSQQCVDLIEGFEGFRPKAYVCPGGHLTIGYGTTRCVYAGMTVTRSQAEEMLKADLAIVDQEMTRLIMVPLNQNQWDALACFTYNAGSGTLAKSTLLKYVNAEQFEQADMEFRRYCYVRRDGQMVIEPGLCKRRDTEAFLFKTPVPPAPIKYAGTLPPPRNNGADDWKGGSRQDTSQRIVVPLGSAIKWLYRKITGKEFPL